MDGDTVPCTIDGQAMVSDGKYSIAFISFHWLFLLSYFFRVYIVRQSIPPHGAIGIGMLPYAKKLLISLYLNICTGQLQVSDTAGVKMLSTNRSGLVFPNVPTM